MKRPETMKTEEIWRHLLVEGHGSLLNKRKWLGWLPSNPRCKMCNTPFRGVGGVITKLRGVKPLAMNPNFCNYCVEDIPDGGADVELSMMFADVRGSTSMAEKLSSVEFKELLNRFYEAASRILIHRDAWIDKLVGDEVVSLFLPGFVGKDHAKTAVETGIELLRVTGHSDEQSPWLPIGVGIHTGTAYVGGVGSTEHGITDITALGDAMNTTARLVSQAGAGEIFLSEAAYQASHLQWSNLESRQLSLKGKEQPVDVRVLQVATVQN